MRTKIDWAELHAPLFLAGTNLGQKLPKAEHKNHIHMEYDEEKRHLYVTYNKKTCRIPETSVLSMVEGSSFTVKVAPDETDAVRPAFDPNAAQVDTPTAHVHAGPGKGQTGRGGKVK